MGMASGVGAGAGAVVGAGAGASHMFDARPGTRYRMAARGTNSFGIFKMSGVAVRRAGVDADAIHSFDIEM